MKKLIFILVLLCSSVSLASTDTGTGGAESTDTGTGGDQISLRPSCSQYLYKSTDTGAGGGESTDTGTGGDSNQALYLKCINDTFPIK